MTDEQKTLSENLDEFLYLGEVFDKLMANEPDQSELDDIWRSAMAKVLDRRQELLLELTKGTDKA